MKTVALLGAFILLSMFVLSPLAVAREGVISGGGGGAYVCRDPSTKNVISAELVDLFEARANNIKIKYDDQTPIEKQVLEAIKKLKIIAPAFGEKVAEAWIAVYGHQAGGADVVVDVPQDVDKHYSKEGCPLEGMMYFDDRRQNLVINPSIFSKQKTKTDFAASYLHEAIYKAMRDSSLPGGSDSVLTRILVGCLVADQDVGACLRLHKTARPAGSDVWSCDVVGDEGIAVSFFLSGAVKSQGYALQATLTSVGKKPLAYKTVLQFNKRIQTLPDFDSDSHGLYLDLKDAQIVGLKELGNPVGDLLATIEIPKNVIAGVPLEIKVNDSGLKYICKGI